MILNFSIIINAEAGDIAAVMSTNITNTGSCEIKLKYLNPYIKNLVVPGYPDDPERMLGMIPKEAGEVVNLCRERTIGMSIPGFKTMLPGTLNVMEVANMYDRDGNGGVFFADLDGDLNRDISPVQIAMKECEAWGIWLADSINPGVTVITPRIAIGVNHDGNYQTAVDYYVSYHSKYWKFPNTPEWFKEAGGVWCAGGAGSGGAYMAWGYCDLSLLIPSFDALPEIYDQAAAMGTNFFYLNDYWEGNVPGFQAHYWDKGDYIPRADLGGEDALVRGIKGIHDKGGKVILYIEAFIIYADSKIGRKHGHEWAARTADGNLWITYADNYSMVAPHEDWQNYVADISRMLVEKYDADGVFLDSFGYQFNKSVKNLAENRLYTPKEWNKGVYRLVDKVRAAITSVKPDAVVMCEGVNGEMGMHLDGGSSFDFVWSSADNYGRITASPVRYGKPQINFFTNGTTMNHLIQVYAAGQSLALNYKWNEHAGFIKKLLDIRRTYKDAMIYGRQSQPETGNMRVAAYYYAGECNRVITIVNVDEKNHTVNIKLNAEDAGSIWLEALTGEEYKAGEAADLMVKTQAGTLSSSSQGLKILIRKN